MDLNAFSFNEKNPSKGKEVELLLILVTEKDNHYFFLDFMKKTTLFDNKLKIYESNGISSCLNILKTKILCIRIDKELNYSDFERLINNIMEKEFVTYRSKRLNGITPNEIRVLFFLSRGVSTNIIARKLNMSIKNISAHKRNSFSKLGYNKTNF
ncbi:helix-turn-helix domain-containing protein [Klebsiella grimontii]|uniref:helix-turn-helix domain-containing protein n=1 Tax=Klebsiella grimontii TaxID=2058152 RepID=UPI001404F027|nr:helix-turn-helix transcriptional regulator [Klebsiella grimontii]